MSFCANCVCPGGVRCTREGQTAEWFISENGSVWTGQPVAISCLEITDAYRPCLYSHRGILYLQYMLPVIWCTAGTLFVLWQDSAAELGNAAFHGTTVASWTQTRLHGAFFSIVMMWSASSLRHGPVFQRASSMKLLTSSAAWLHAFVPAKCFHLNTYRDTCSCSKLCPEPPEQVGNYVCIYTNKWEIMYAFTLCLKKNITSPNVNRFSKFFHWQTHW